MKILVAATKSPWPAVDGGRQLLASTLEALVNRGHEPTVVFPAQPSDVPCPLDGCRGVPVPVKRRSRLFDLAASQIKRQPFTIHRHDHPEVAARVAELLATEDFDLLHAEQVQAMASAAPAAARGLPIVLRAQNVESALWRGLARRRWYLWPLLMLEARRLAAAEGEAVRAATTTLALTYRDAAGLTALAGKKVIELAAFAPAELPAGEKLEGDPALILFGGGAWPPNRDGARFFLKEIWPAIAAEFPTARVHVFGDPGAQGERVKGHPSPAESRQAFPQGGILLVPLFVGSGVRMKILESWARGLPVVATQVAARGLLARPGEELEIAEDAPAFAAALRKLIEPEAAQNSVEAGRDLLRREHDPAKLAARLEEIYRDAISA